MPTWQDEFVRLSELHRHEVEKWLEGAHRRHWTITLENLRRYVNGDKIINVVDVARAY